MEKWANLKCKTKDFFNRNKGKIKICAKIGVIVIGVGTGGYLIIDNRKKDETINCMYEIIIKQRERIEGLKEICERKDTFMNGFISKLLRQGNPEGARQMAYKRWN